MKAQIENDMRPVERLLDGLFVCVEERKSPLASRTEGNRLVRLKGGEELMGKFVNVKITGSNTWALYGEAE